MSSAIEKIGKYVVAPTVVAEATNFLLHGELGFNLVDGAAALGTLAATYLFVPYGGYRLNISSTDPYIVRPLSKEQLSAYSARMSLGKASLNMHVKDLSDYVMGRETLILSGSKRGTHPLRFGSSRRK